MNYSFLLEQIRDRINSAEQIFFNNDDLISEFGGDYENYLADLGRYDTSLVAEAFFECDEVAPAKPEILLNPPASMDDYKILRMRFVRYIDSKGRDIRSFKLIITETIPFTPRIPLMSA